MRPHTLLDTMFDPTELLASAPTPSMSSSAYDAIRRSIMEGTLRPGERIVEERLAKALSISRTPVREALQRLESERLVERGERGLVVASYSVSDVRDLFDLRVQVECYGAGLAADRIRPDELDALRREHAGMLAALDQPTGDEMAWLKELKRLNTTFHVGVVQAARHAGLERIISPVIHVPLVYTAYVWFDEEHRRRSAREHGVLLDHLADRDATAAADCWKRHLEAGRDVVVSRLAARKTQD